MPWFILFTVLLCGACPVQGAERDPTAYTALEEALTAFSDLRPDRPSPRHHQRAVLLFRLGRFSESVADFQVAVQAGGNHDADSCWELGLAQYYAGDIREGASQFERYHRVGPTDVENGLWYFLCVAEAEGIAVARERMFDYPRKRGAPFPSLLALYLGEGTPEAVLAEAEAGDLEAAERGERLFYAQYYLGKYFDIQKDYARAHRAIAAALEHAIPHFMADCAREDARRVELRIENLE